MAGARRRSGIRPPRGDAGGREGSGVGADGRARVVTRVIIVGGGRAGTALLDLLAGERAVQLLGLVDINERAPGVERARALGIPTVTDYKEFLRDGPVDVVIDVTGNPEVHRTLEQLKPEATEVMGGAAADLVLRLLGTPRLPWPARPEGATAPDGPEGFPRAKERMIAALEREALTRYLRQTAGNISRAAVAAGVTRRTFHRLLAKHRISHREFRPAR